jgi:hypothetical protein
MVFTALMMTNNIVLLTGLTMVITNLHQVCPKSKIWKDKQFKVLGAIKPKDLNRIAKVIVASSPVGSNQTL